MMILKVVLMPVLLIGAFLFYNFGTVNNENSVNQVVKNNLGITPDVQKIIDNSCFGCHNAASKNEKGKAKLMFESLDTLNLAKLVGKLADLGEEVSKDKMPPARFLEFNPGAKLTPEQKEALVKWADSASNSLLEKK